PNVDRDPQPIALEDAARWARDHDRCNVRRVGSEVLAPEDLDRPGTPEVDDPGPTGDPLDDQAETALAPDRSGDPVDDRIRNRGVSDRRRHGGDREEDPTRQTRRKRRDAGCPA